MPLRCRKATKRTIVAREEGTADKNKHLVSMATAPRNVPALEDVDGPEDLDKFVKELMDNMVS